MASCNESEAAFRFCRNSSCKRKQFTAQISEGSYTNA